MSKSIPVDILMNGIWERLPNVTATQIDSNTYELTITTLNVIGRMSRMDNDSIRVDGRKSIHVFPGRFYNETLVFRVRVDDSGDRERD